MTYESKNTLFWAWFKPSRTEIEKFYPEIFSNSLQVRVNPRNHSDSEWRDRLPSGFVGMVLFWVLMVVFAVSLSVAAWEIPLSIEQGNGITTGF